MSLIKQTILAWFEGAIHTKNSNFYDNYKKTVVNIVPIQMDGGVNTAL